jgi:hypothetical protein
LALLTCSHIQSSWLPNSGGCLNGVSWRQNPQYSLTVATTKNSSVCSVHIQLARPISSTKVSMGVYIVPRLSMSRIDAQKPESANFRPSACLWPYSLRLQSPSNTDFGSFCRL